MVGPRLQQKALLKNFNGDMHGAWILKPPQFRKKDV